MPIYPYQDKTPVIHPTAFIHPEAVIIGDVVIGVDASVWPGVVIRGDVNWIRIGARSNIQDGSVLHVGRSTENRPDGAPLFIGDDVTIGHNVTLHGCHIENGSMVGIGAIILDMAVVGHQAMVGAGAVVTPGRRIDDSSLWLGSPAKMKRLLSDQEIAAMRATTEKYCRLAWQYTERP
ncbi:MAG: gamma carbonic anhydrase family protein [Magnetococcales bacterium]|nr:gamma carbonic anhydrase family protein [Magnetococcales bacterium]